MPRYVIPGPVEVARALQSDPNSFIVATEQTLVDAGAGLIGGLVLGFVLAVLIGESRFMAAMALPWVLLLRSIPITAVASLLTLVAGYGIATVVIIAAIVAFFPTYVLVGVGLRDTPPGAAEVFATLGASRYDVLFKLRIPSSLVSALGALRVAAAGAVLGAMVGEWTTSARGLGNLIVTATGAFDVDRVWATGLIATLLAVIAFVVADRLSRAISARIV